MLELMFATFLASLPVFGLIGAGALAARARVLTLDGGGILNRYVTWLALPALLFKTVADAKWEQLWQPAFIASFCLSGLITLAVAMMVVRLRSRRSFAQSAIDSLNASYPNVGFMGFPLAAALLSPAALVPTTIAAILTMCVFFALTIVLVELGLNTGAGMLGVSMKVMKGVLRHPLIVAPACGVPFALTGQAIPSPIATLASLLAASAAPCALAAIGIFMLQPRSGTGRGENAGAAGLIGGKLLLQPLLAWIFAQYVFDLGRESVQIAVLMAALPTGTGAFMLAGHYQLDVALPARVIAGSTLASIATISVIFALLQ
ncbi:AEC family transporter [Achromobacter deleyi]|uniref:AEC family transporter n=1 Tax=Achromobacter deleyi TaxID=1353891 RepID=UPI001466F1C0|nr:AEC family transporter [Achromobacter deleyi]CAB3837429.1 hypothetical protein LMG3412_01068 [Achromobacter deleyi]